MIGRRRIGKDHVPPPPGRGAVRGAAIGFVLVGIGVTLLARLTGYELREAAAMGLFVAAWGGCGFGAMLGGTISFLRMEDRAAEAMGEPPHEQSGDIVAGTLGSDQR